MPHLTAFAGNPDNELIGELRRFSVNPLLEAGPLLADNLLKAVLRDYRRLVYRGLYELSLHIFRAMNIHFVYIIATPATYRFFTRDGMIMSLVEGVLLAENDEVHMLQQEFARYWQPEAPLEQQPALYRIHLG